MSNWDYLNSHRIRIPGYPDTDATWGFNGAFEFYAGESFERSFVRAIASDGGGWQHVSVSVVGRPSTVPRWVVMCAVKDLFWDAEDTVVQYHPAKSNYVNYHAGCLHLWRPTELVIPVPPMEYVGPKTP